MHAVIVVKHRWRAEELKSANHGVAENMGYRDRSQAEANLDEDHSDLSERRERERGLGVRAGATGNRAVNGRHEADHNNANRGDSGFGEQRLHAEEKVCSGMNRYGAVE